MSYRIAALELFLVIAMADVRANAWQDAQPSPATAHQAGRQSAIPVTIVCDLDCVFAVGRATPQRAKAGVATVVHLSPGKHLIRALAARGMASWDESLIVGVQKQPKVEVHLKERQEEIAGLLRDLSEKRRETASLEDQLKRQQNSKQNNK